MDKVFVDEQSGAVTLTRGGRDYSFGGVPAIQAFAVEHPEIPKVTIDQLLAMNGGYTEVGSPAPGCVVVSSVDGIHSYMGATLSDAWKDAAKHAVANYQMANGISLYKELVAAGVEVSNHESDLYVPITPETTAILDRFPLQKGNATTFKSNTDGAMMFDVPFAFDPAWEKKRSVPIIDRGDDWSRPKIKYIEGRGSIAVQNIGKTSERDRVIHQEAALDKPPPKLGASHTASADLRGDLKSKLIAESAVSLDDEELARVFKGVALEVFCIRETQKARDAGLTMDAVWAEAGFGDLSAWAEKHVGKPVAQVEDGLVYKGRVLAENGHALVQNIGREVVIHEKAALDKRLSVDTVASVVYQGGCGAVTIGAQELGQGQGVKR